MGFKPKRKVFDLRFDDPSMNGLVVKVRGVNTGTMLDLRAARASDDDDSIRDMLELLGQQLLEWNVVDEDDAPVPATLEGVRQQDLDFNMAILDAWQNVMAGVPAPLDGSSTSGEPSLVASIPTETLSESLAS
ncbi:hypothetical protein [Streptomyces uncialis]|uniref:hypothetical protein n=1 Tax=Streptomyces uncialis TaxID=1048205 RepID=UPI003789B59A